MWHGGPEEQTYLSRPESLPRDSSSESLVIPAVMPTAPRVARDLLLKPSRRLELHGPVQCVHQWLDMSQVGMIIYGNINKIMH